MKKLKKVAQKAVKKVAKAPVKKKLARPVKKVVKRAAKKPVARKKPSRKIPVKHLVRQQFMEKVALKTPEPVKERVVVRYPVLPWAETERIKILLPILREFVRKNMISDWRVNLAHVRSANVYVGNEFMIEDELTAIREDVHLTVYKRFSGEQIGEATIPIVSVDPLVLRQQVQEAATACSYVKKNAFSLPEPQEGITFPESYDKNMLQQFMESDGLSTPLALYNQIRTLLQGVRDVKTNCFEILTNACTFRVLNSNGVDVSFHKTALYVEVILSCKDKADEREFTWSATAVSPEQFDFKHILAQQAQAARDALAAMPNPGFTGDTLLTGQALTEFFAPNDTHNPVIMHAAARLKAMSLSTFTLGQPIGQFKGESLTVSSNPTLPLGLMTMPVDDDGTPMHPLEVIRNGIFTNWIAPAQYAQYLGVPITGGVANIHVGTGAIREDYLRGNNYVEIVLFSWFKPDPLSGDFSAEIRLGYQWSGGKKTPFRGGHLTGNVFENLLNARFSREAIQSGRYYGPRAVLFKNAQVVKNG